MGAFDNYLSWRANLGTTNISLTTGSTLTFAGINGLYAQAFGNTIAFGLGGSLTQNTQIGTSSWSLSFVGLGGTQALFIGSSGSLVLGLLIL